MTPFLVAKNIVTGFEKCQVLNDVSVTIDHGEIVTLTGHNASGKSTLLKTMYGIVPIWKGAIIVNGTHIPSPTPAIMRSLGIVYVPQKNNVYTDLTVRDNLLAAGITLKQQQRNAAIENVLGTFPQFTVMLHRLAGMLSGGERQMLALARTLMISPRLMLLDEPIAGLSPEIIPKVLGNIQQVQEKHDLAMLVVEHQVKGILTIAQRVIVMQRGVIVFNDTPDNFDNKKLL